MNKQQILETIDALQNWFAGKPYGWRATATSDQIKQHEDRMTELDQLVARLESM